MSERKVEIYKIIRDKWQYLLEEPARELIHDIAKEACRQALELATENALIDEKWLKECNSDKKFEIERYDSPLHDISWSINKQSILDTINQVE